jgi:FkbM family methyltransferase
LLKSNLSASLSQALCHSVQAAVWSDGAQLAIAKPESKGHVNQFRVKPVVSDVDSHMRVLGMTIQQIIEMAGFESIDILKVDIEGAEVELFKGNTDWLSRVQWLAIEFHDASRKESNFDYLMSERGWKILDESTHTVVAGRA